MGKTKLAKFFSRLLCKLIKTIFHFGKRAGEVVAVNLAQTIDPHVFRLAI